MHLRVGCVAITWLVWRPSKYRAWSVTASCRIRDPGLAGGEQGDSYMSGSQVGPVLQPYLDRFGGGDVHNPASSILSGFDRSFVGSRQAIGYNARRVQWLANLV